MNLAAINNNKIRFIVPALFVGYGLLCLKITKGYLVWDTNLLIGIAIILYAAQPDRSQHSNRLLVPALLFSLLAGIIPVRSTLFFMLLFTLLLLFENVIGKLSLIVVFTMIIISPIFQFFSDTLSFPLRLWLSNIVAETMTFVGIPVKSVGNLIMIKNYEFYIDQACAGLNMLHLSLLIALFIAASQQGKERNKIAFIPLCLFLVITFILNIISNYFRILMIVLFKIMPGNIFHDLAGIICLIIYVIVPLAIFSSQIINWLNKNLASSTHVNLNLRKTKVLVLHIILITTLGFLAFKPKYIHETPTHDGIQLQGFRKNIVAGNVVKLENQTALIYLKPTPFYAPEHNPMICWTGSGYEFKLIRKMVFNGTEIYSGTLQKGKEKIYAAWWFDNGKLKTIDQWRWRWHGAIHREPFYLVNVNAAKPADLHKLIKQLLANPLILNR